MNAPHNEASQAADLAAATIRKTSYLMETAACIWEAVLNMLDDEENGRGVGHPVIGIARAFERLGSSTMRLTALSWAEMVDADYQIAKAAGYDDPFDWEFCPAWITANVDWSSHYPTVQNPRVVPTVSERPSSYLAIPGYDVSATLVLNAVVRTNGGEEAVRAAVLNLVNRFSAASEGLDGAAYDVPAVTEFSVNCAGETVDVDALIED